MADSKIRRVEVKARGMLRRPTTVWLEEGEPGEWAVYARDPYRARQHGEAPIGTVLKSTYTYSPPAAGFGGRIVRYHKKCPCWRVGGERRSTCGYKTRQEALRRLVIDRAEGQDHPGAAAGLGSP